MRPGTGVITCCDGMNKLFHEIDEHYRSASSYMKCNQLKKTTTDTEADVVDQQMDDYSFGNDCVPSIQWRKISAGRFHNSFIRAA